MPVEITEADAKAALLQTERLKALTEQIAARKAYEAALKPPAASSPPSAEAVAEAGKKLAETQKATLEARNAATKAAFGDLPSSGATGAVTLGSGAGSAEATLLCMLAVQEIAALFADTLCAVPTPALKKPQRARQWLLYPDGSGPDIRRWRAFQLRKEALQSRVNAAMALSAAAPTAKAVLEVAATVAMAVTAIGTALTLAKSAASWFKSDHEFGGVEVAASDGMLLTAVAQQLMARKQSVRLPGAPAGASFMPSATVLADLSWPFETLQLAREHEVAANGNPTAARVWNFLVSELQAWTESLLAVNAAEPSPLAALVQEAGLSDLLAAGAEVVTLKLHRLAGSTQVEKMWLSGIWEVPLYISGSAVAAMHVHDGRTGELLAARLLPWHGGRMSVQDVRRNVNPPP